MGEDPVQKFWPFFTNELVCWIFFIIVIIINTIIIIIIINNNIISIVTLVLKFWTSESNIFNMKCVHGDDDDDDDGDDDQNVWEDDTLR